jgi:uncharacterized membrane protein YcjF (UPF0283 family)
LSFNYGICNWNFVISHLWYRGRGVRLSSAKAATTVRVCSVPQTRCERRVFLIMLTKEDENFIQYWSNQRQRKKQFLSKTSIGLPLGVFIVLATMVSLLTGWYQRADMVLHEYSSLIIVILLAGLGIVVFITIFSAQHKWDQNELHYQELLRKKQQDINLQQEKN